MKKIILAALIALLSPAAVLASFKDVPQTSRFYDAINYVQSQGIVEGYADGTFKPDNTINRAEFTKIIVGASDFKDELSSCLMLFTSYTYKDTSINEWYMPYLCVATEKSIVKGYADGTFKPQNNINMAEASKIIYTGFNYGAPGAERFPWYKTYIEYLEGKAAIPSTVTSLDKNITRGEMAEMIYRIKNNIANKPTTSFSDSFANAISTGKRIEFMEQNSDPVDPDEAAKIKIQAQTMLDKVLAGGDLAVLGQEEAIANPWKVYFIKTDYFQFKDEISTHLQEALFNLETGKTLDHLIEYTRKYSIYSPGQLIQGNPSYSIVQVTGRQTQSRTITTPKQIFVSHILVSFKSAQAADTSITRTEEQAKARAEDILTKLEAETNFAATAEVYSDDAISRDIGGRLTLPVQNDGTYVKEFEDVANATADGQISEIFESPFGFHILKVDGITEATTETKTEPQIKYVELYYSTVPSPWKNTGLNSDYLVKAEVQYDQNNAPYIMIEFNEEGSRLLEELTARNVGKPLAIFVDGQLISAPNVNEKISGGRAQISGRFTVEQAYELADDINKGINP